MLAEDMELQGLDETMAVPDWLRSLIRDIRSQAIRPKDERVRQLWNLLRQRQVLRRSAWTKRLLRRIWDNGLAARPRPKTTRRLVRRLRRLGILPPLARRVAQTAPLRPVRPVAVRPVKAQPVIAQRR